MVSASICDCCSEAENLTQEGPLNSNELAHQIIEIVEEKQAQDIVLLDVSEQTSIADYFILATVDTERQANAIREDLHKVLHIQQKVRPLNMEGVEGGGGGWVLVDYGDVILHLFTAETRAYYDLEGLWSKATVVMKMI